MIGNRFRPNQLLLWDATNGEFVAQSAFELLDVNAASLLGVPSPAHGLGARCPYLGVPSGIRNPHPLISSGSQTFALSLGDVDHDGRVDIVIARSPGPNQLLLNAGEAGFVDGTTRGHANTELTQYGEQSTVWGARALALGDLDGDTHLDLIIGGYALPYSWHTA